MVKENIMNTKQNEMTGRLLIVGCEPEMNSLSVTKRSKCPRGAKDLRVPNADLLLD